SHCLEEAESLGFLRQPPHCDNYLTAWPSYPPRLPNRSHGISRILERVEGGDHVEPVILKGQSLHIAELERGIRDALACDRQQLGSGVESRNARAALGRDHACSASSASHVEQGGAPTQLCPIEYLLVEGENCPLLHRGPVPSARSPQWRLHS